MAIYRLIKEVIFPDPEEAEPDGLLAVGGDLSPKRLIAAYARGIFPWYSEPPILWFSPDPRLVLFPEELHVASRLHRQLAKNPFEIRMDTAFESVIQSCARINRKDQAGTWITEEMIQAYIDLHKIGIAHSVESWRGGNLVGGLYGVSLGRAFFGESMFTLTSNASKAAFVRLIEKLKEWEFHFIDCQVHTTHLTSFGAKPIPRSEFLRALKKALWAETKQGLWSFT